MFRNYLKIVLRNLRKHNSFSMINIGGLAIGMAGCLLISLFIYDEFSFDNMFVDADRIYRLNIDHRVGGETNKFAAVASPMAATLARDFSQIEMITRFRLVGSTLIRKPDAELNVKENHVVGADSAFFDMFGLDLIAGNAKTALTEPNSLVLTKTAAEKHFGANEALGQNLILGGTANRMIVKLHAGNFSNVIADIEQIWNSIAPGLPFNYYFMDDSFNDTYKTELRLGNIFITFTILSIVIACLGLFGLAIFNAEKRTKEIGVRKVLGATVANLVGFLSKDFVKLVLLANVIAWPVAWYAMSRWLQNFTYRIDISWWVFALAGGVALMIALLTVSTLAIKAALANPVEALRYE